MPKFTDAEIDAEINQLEPGGFKCAAYYLKAELKRRKASQINKGRPLKHDDPRHEQMREASRRYREKKKLG